MSDNGASSQPNDELTPQERAGIIAWHLCDGEKLSIERVMRLTGLKERGAYTLLDRLARKLPIYRDEGIWMRLWNENKTI